MSKRLVKLHSNAELFEGYRNESNTRRFPEYVLEHTTEVSGDDIIFTACLKINTNSRKGQKLLKEMLEKQSSPIKSVLQAADREHKIDVREERAAPLYHIPDNFIDKL